ncbi:hypothetical protein C5142_03540 [Rhodococcus sp. BGS-1C]|nr:hypothetical protein [Rhodococcus sp. I2R]OLT33092.1 hypothetical protein BJF84_24120 [Rhodococcus sp. CUA-806]
MRKMKSVTTMAATVLAAASVTVAVGGGTAAAEPAESIGYQTTVELDGSTKTVLDAGAFRIDTTADTVSVVGDSGAVLATLPLTYSLNGATYSIAPLLEGDRELLLTPQPAALLTEVAEPVSKQAAFDNMINQLAIGYTNGGAIGTAVGAGLGFAIGCVSIFPNFISGCIIGTAIGAVAGTIIGTANANPEVQPAVFEYFTTP